ncbi:PAS domain S-box protein [bacterium]|nr:PAS domain S-box protein [bacterium]
MLKTVKVPKEFEPLFTRAQKFVSTYFKERKENASKGTIEIFGQRYIFVRAASMSVEFFEMIKNTYKDKSEEEALAVARSLLFDIAHAIGVADARSFHKKMKLKDPIEKLSAGPVHFSHSGWAFVDIFPESRPTPDENYYLIYDHPYSFESDSWIKAKKKVDFPVCVMNSGYSSGWCEESFGIKLVATEILCKAKGDDHCRFIMGHPSRVGGYIKDYLKAQPKLSKKITKYEIPGFFSRKTAEDELRKTLDELEIRIEERTAELTKTNTKLKKEIIKRQERETALRQSEEAYRKLIETANDAIFVANAKTGIVINANKKAEELIGLPAEKIIGMHQSELHPPEDAEKTTDTFQNLAQKPEGHTDFFHVQHVDGRKIPVEISSSISELGGERIVQGIFRDMTEREKSLMTERLRAEKTIRYQEALLELSKIDHSDLDLVLKKTTQVNAKTLEVERVGVWFFNEDGSSIITNYLYVNSKDQYVAEERLNVRDYPSYFEALSSNRIVIATDIHTNPATRELARDYFAPLDIRSMMDIPIRFHGKAYGVICHEQVGKTRVWSIEDQEFATSVADTISLALESSERSRVERKNIQYVRELEALAKVSQLLGHTIEVKPLLENMLQTLKTAILAVEKGSIMLLDEKSQELYCGAFTGYVDPRIKALRISVNMGYSGFAIRERRGILVSDVNEHKYEGDIEEITELKSAIVTPLITKKRIVGTIALETSVKTEAFTEDDLRLLNVFAGTASTVIENAQLYENLIQSELRYRTFVESFHDTIFIMDYSMRMLYANPSLERQTGYSLKDFQFLQEENPFIHPDDQKRVTSFVRRFIVGSEAYSDTIENRFIDKWGNVHWYNSVISKITYNDQPALQFITYDISDRKRAEEALRESEQQYRALIEQSSNPVYIIQFDKLILVNEAWEKLFEYNRAEVMAPGFDYMNLIVSEYHDMIWERRRKRKHGEKVENHYELSVITKSGLKRDVEVSVAEITWKNHPAIQGVYYDITERKKAEAAIAEEKELLMVTLRSIGDGVITTDVNGRIILMNKVAESLTGWTQEEVLNQSIDQVLTIVDYKTREKFTNPILKIIDSDGFFELLNDTILIAKDGSERLITDSGAPIKNKDGEVIGTVIVFRDVTEKRKMEEERIKSIKLESVGLLAGGIAHDFNNILTAILGNIALAKMDVESNNKERLTDILNRSEKASYRAKELTQQLLTFSRGGTPIRKAAAVGELIRESADFMIRGSNVLCEYQIADDLWHAEIDQGQIGQVIHNLVINSIQAMPDGGFIRIFAENVHVDELSSTPRSGNYVKIIFKDMGMGIPPEHLAKIFDPYFTTKQRGSGLGLATCYSIIKKHDGYITAESQLGSGTTFFIYLPASGRQLARPEEYKMSIGQGSGRVLVMDDEEDIRDITSRILKKIGYESAAAGDGIEAIKMYKEAKDSGKGFDAVIMDLTIPGGMGGKDAIKKLLEYDPHAKVIVASGYSNDPVISNFRKHGFSGFIVKPYDIEEFKILLHNVLSQSESKT